LTGSTYSAPVLHRYLAALKGWRSSLPPADQARLQFRYAGSDHRRVAVAVAAAGLADISTIESQLPLDVLAQCARQAVATSYLWAPFGFHHKLLELLVAGAPVLAFPGEHGESVQLAEHSDTPF